MRASTCCTVRVRVASRGPSPSECVCTTRTHRNCISGSAPVTPSRESNRKEGRIAGCRRVPVRRLSASFPAEKVPSAGLLRRSHRFFSGGNPERCEPGRSTAKAARLAKRANPLWTTTPAHFATKIPHESASRGAGGPITVSSGITASSFYPPPPRPFGVFAFLRVFHGSILFDGHDQHSCAGCHQRGTSEAGSAT